MCKVLIFSCISAVVLLTAAYGAPLANEDELLLTTLIKDLNLLEKSKNRIPHLLLYTPSDTKECSHQTLQCYLKETDILVKETEDEYGTEDEDAATLKRIRNNLQGLVDLTPQGTGCKICEASNRESFPAFHRGLLDFLIFLRKSRR